MGAFIATPTSRNKIRILTSVIRREFGLADERFFPVMHFLEMGLPALDEKFDYEILPVDEMRDSYAITYPEENKIAIREDVYINAANDVPRDRFTIAHEIGHYIMHGPNGIGLARNDKKEKVPPYKDPEWQANTFAGELLAPPKLIRGLSLNEITLYCGVSFDVARIQLKNT